MSIWSRLKKRFGMRGGRPSGAMQVGGTKAPEERTPEEASYQCTVCGKHVVGSGPPGPCPHCAFRTREVDGITVVRCVPVTRVLTADIGLLYESLAHSDAPPRLIVDLSDVESVSKRFLGRLASLYLKVKAAKGRLVLCGVRPAIWEILDITRLVCLFDVFENVEDALNDL